MSEFIYKYRKYEDRALDILRKKELWLATPESLNDPFDCQIEYAELFDAAISKLQISSKAIQSFKSAALEVVSDLRVLSLSRGELNPLLWAHYSDRHKGFCLGFDEYQLGMSERLRPQEVEYTDELPFLAFSERLLKSNFKDKSHRIELISTLENFTYKVALTKPKEWVVENEFRIVHKHPMQGNVRKFGRLALKEVIFGLNMDEPNQDEIIEILSIDEWKHVKLFKIEKGLGSFNLTKRQIYRK
ncbi:MAG: DUF2971 domain-containing protein [Colwellia sp.]